MMTQSLRNIAAKWIRLGAQKFSIRPIVHEAMPGILIQPIQQSDGESNPPMHVIIIDESTDFLITFESFESARALCHAVNSVVAHGPPRPGAGSFDLDAEVIIREIERATRAARDAGISPYDTQAQARATHAENKAIRSVLKTFHSLPI